MALYSFPLALLALKRMTFDLYHWIFLLRNIAAFARHRTVSLLQHGFFVLLMPETNYDVRWHSCLMQF